MDKSFILINDSRKAIERERKAIRKGGEPAAIPDHHNTVLMVQESDPRIVAAMLESGKWGVITRYTRGRKEVKVYWVLSRIA